jgi:endonuclease YncB( thermonuclease family)
MGWVACLAALGWVLFPDHPGQTVRVVGVHDGDSLTVLTAANTQLKVRLQGVDAPEARQPFGAASKASLSEMVFGKAVRLDGTGKDRYGRTLGDVFVDGRWINRMQVERGLAWHYRQYSADPRLASAEEEARNGRRGLWQQAEDAVPPWEWRRSSRK